jgi:hypothetical protein
MKTILSALVASSLLFTSTSFALTKTSRKVTGTVSVNSNDELLIGDNSGGNVNINLPSCSGAQEGRSLTVVVLDNNNVVNINAASGDGFYNDPSYGTTAGAAGGGTTLDLDCSAGQWYIH